MKEPLTPEKLEIMEELTSLSSQPDIQDQALSIARDFYQSGQQMPSELADFREWEQQRQRLRYLAQLEINKLNSNSRNVYQLYKGLGIAVTWPNFWQRLSIRREKEFFECIQRNQSARKAALICLFENIESQRAEQKQSDQGSSHNEIKKIILNRSIRDFNSRMTEYGNELGLTYELFKYVE